MVRIFHVRSRSFFQCNPRFKLQKAKSSLRTMELPFSKVFKLSIQQQKWFVVPLFRYILIGLIHHIQLVDLSAAQDIEAGDGTTSVVVLAGAFLGAAEKMLQKGIHPTIVAEAFFKASSKAVEILTEISTPVDLNDKSSLLRAASTSLNSKVSRLFLC